MSLGGGGAARIYASYKSMAELEAATGGPGEDGSWIRRVGGRLDWSGGRSTVTVSGDVFDSDFGSLTSFPVATPPFVAAAANSSRNNGGHVLTRVRHSFEGGSSLTLQAYFDRKSRPSTRLDGKEQTLDVEIQHDVSLGERQDLIWGIGYRHVAQVDTAGNDFAFNFGFEPPRHEEDVVNVFAQDRISLVSDRFRVTLGAKMERNGYTGWEVQPKISLAVLPSREQTLWASVSRAVRVPTRLDRDARFDVAIFPVSSNQLAYVSLQGGDVGVERLTAYEVGYRLTPIHWLTLDLSGFVNRYEDLIVFAPSAPEFTPTPPPGHFTIQYPVVNGGEGNVIGGEAIVRVEPLTGWVLEGSYSHLDDHLRLKDGMPEASLGLAQGRAPRHQVRFRSSTTLLGELDVDVAVRYVSALDGLGIDGGTAMDAKVSWVVSRFVDVAVAGRNIFAGARRWFVPEFGTSFASLIPPSFSTSLSVRF
jgi:iron complex outermembrane receptor protein